MKPYVLNFFQQNAVRHELDLCVIGCISFVPYLVRHFPEKIEPCATLTKSWKNNISGKCGFQGVRILNKCACNKNRQHQCAWNSSHKCVCKQSSLHKCLYNETVYTNVQAMKQSTQMCMQWNSLHKFTCTNVLTMTYESISTLNNFNRRKEANWLRGLIQIINKKRIIQN